MTLVEFKDYHNPKKSVYINIDKICYIYEETEGHSDHVFYGS